MNEAKKYQLQDLIEKIDRVDKMIKFHSTSPSKLMLVQYEAKKEKLLSYLIDELVDAKLRSPYSFRLVMMALNKYYPEIQKQKKPIKDKHYEDLKELELVLA